MKKRSLFLVLFLIFTLFGIFGQTVRAAEENVDCDYTVKEDGGKYHLYDGGRLTASDENLAALFDNIEKDGSSVLFDGVISNEELVLSDGKLSFSGKLDLRSLKVEEGAELSIRDAEVTLLQEPISVLGGKFYVFDSGIVAERTAVTVKNSGEAILERSTVSSASNSPAIFQESGKLSMKDSSVVNKFGCGIESHAELLLESINSFESPTFDIRTDKPISLSADHGWKQRVSVQYLGLFKKGSETLIASCAEPFSIEEIEVFDADGKKYGLTSRVNENYTASVYLPYEISYYLLGKRIQTANYLRGETVQPPEKISEGGFELLGWYADAEFKNEFSFGSEVSSDLTLYAKCLLDPVRYSLSDVSFEYDGKEHIIYFTELSHELYGNYTFTWRCLSGDIVSKTSTFSVKNVSDSGYYQCTIGFSVGSFYTETETPPIRVDISKKKVGVPTVPVEEYTSKAVYPKIPESEYYTFEEKAYFDAGIYGIELNLTDGANFTWEDSSFSGVLDFKIEKAKNYWVTPLGAVEGYVWAEPTFKCKAGFGEVDFLYSEEKNGVFTTKYPAALGDFYVKAVVAEGANWEGIESEVQKLKISLERVVSIKTLSYPNKTEYVSFTQFDPSGLSLCVKFDSGREVTVKGEDCIFKYERADSFRAMDSGVKVICYGEEMVLPITVKKAEYSLDVKLVNSMVEYNGKYQTIDYAGELPTGLDGIPLCARVEGGGSNAGKYEVSLCFTTESEEYNPPSSLFATLEIIPCERELTWEKVSFVYDGSEKVPRAFYYDVFGAKIYASVCGGQTESGKGYSAQAYGDSNYRFTNSTESFDINKADYDLSRVAWSGGSFVYNGERRKVYLSGLPKGISVVGYINNSAVNAGEYSASAIVKYDEKNYNKPQIPTLAWKIQKADYDMSNVSFVSKSYIYDGKLHYPVLEGEMPRGIDGYFLQYKFANGVRDVDEGRKSVAVEFITESVNYNLPKKLYAYVEILPLEIFVEWGKTALYYNAEFQKPTASSELCAVNVTGEGKDVGGYSAFAVSCNNNFIIKNDTVSYEILRADNYWTQPPENFEAYVGSREVGCFSSRFGTVEYAFFRDEAMQLPIDALSETGIFYCCAFVKECENYTGLLSSVLQVTVLPKEISEFSVKIKESADIRAFETLRDGDFDIIVLYNNGTVEKLALSDLTVSYSCGELLKAGKVLLTFSYCGYEVSVEVNVGKADYDMSGVRWENTEAIYDGAEKHAILTGLPKGVEIKAYKELNAINAGVYELYAELSYDENNYNPPILPKGSLIIEKRGVTPSVKYNAVFDKTAHHPESSDPLCYVKNTEGFVNAGEYEIEFGLFDEENYFLTESKGRFTVYPKEIVVFVSDSKRYSDGTNDGFSSEIQGAFVSENELSLEYYVVENEIFVKTDNANYSLTVHPGKLVDAFGFSKNTLLTVIFILLFVILLCILILYILRKREMALSEYFQGGAVAEGDRVNSLTSGAQTVTVMPIGNLSVDVKQAEELLTDSIAKTLIKKSEKTNLTAGNKKCIVNVDTLSENFNNGDVVNVNVLKERGLLPKDAGYLKILARGSINKSLIVEADYFTLGAVKMIALTGGEIYKVNTKRIKKNERKT